MKTKLRHLLWRLFGQPDLPPRKAMSAATDAIRLRDAKRKHLLACFYGAGYSVEHLAKQANVTPERVRQCLWKVYWEQFRKEER